MPKDEEVFENEEQKNDPTSCPSLQPASYKYWFCLTFIPDLQWCHLVPMVPVGEFCCGEEKNKVPASWTGMPKWKLVDERLGQEIDLSSRYVIPVKSRETKKSADANKEEWAIFDTDEGKENERSKKPSKRRRLKAPGQPSSDTKEEQINPLRMGSKTNIICIQSSDSGSKGTGPGPVQPLVLTTTSKAEERKPKPAFQMTLPPMDLDLPTVRYETRITTTYSHRGKGSPPARRSYPLCMCASMAPCPIHHPPPPYRYAPYNYHTQHAEYQNYRSEHPLHEPSTNIRFGGPPYHKESDATSPVQAQPQQHTPCLPTSSRQLELSVDSEVAL